MSCEISNLPKYKKRKSPSIPANDCELGFIEIGNDGKYWQIVSAGKSQRWVKCGTGSTNCTQVIRKSIKKKSGKAKKITKSGKKDCPPGKILSPKGRCIIDRSLTKKPLTAKTSSKKDCPPGKILSPKGRCIIDRSLTKKPLSKKNSISRVSISTSKKSRYFEFNDGSSFKFWKVEPKNKYDVKITFGKIGSEGRDSMHYFSSSTEQNSYIQKKINQKTRKGYKEVSESGKRLTISNKPKITTKKTKKNPPITMNVSNKSKISGVNVSCGSKAWKSVWNIKTNGVMLAHTYKDPKTGKIKNPPKGFPNAPNGWYLSEKFDGYRCIWDGNKFYSRAGNEFVTPDWFRAFMPPGISLDGELFLGRELFEKCGIFRRKVPDDEQWIKFNVKYQIFDSPTHPGMFEERQAFIEKLIKERCKCESKLKLPTGVKCPLVLTKQIKVTNEEEVQKYFKSLTDNGAEGVMLRAPNSPYESKRTSLLLKVKQLFDAECKIVGYKPGAGKYAKMLGAFECVLVKNKKIKFTISGMDDNIRQNYKKTHPIGTTVTFTYMGLSSSGVPRHPNYLRIRKGKL